MVEIAHPRQFRDRIGQELAVSDWFEVTQERIAQFAEATEDRYWIHLNPVRAAAESPYRTTIAHGFLTLSLTVLLARRAMTVGGVRMLVNYGLNRVRFITAVPAGARIRARFKPLSVDEARGSVQVTWDVIIERDGSEKPCCAAEWILRYYHD
jgi:acyl dehydratase